MNPSHLAKHGPPVSLEISYDGTADKIERETANEFGNNGQGFVKQLFIYQKYLFYPQMIMFFDNISFNILFKLNRLMNSFKMYCFEHRSFNYHVKIKYWIIFKLKRKIIMVGENSRGTQP